MPAQFVGVAGLPRAGSTLLCQLLAEHPAIHCEGHSSPLCTTLLATRRTISDDPFMLSQLDGQFDASYGHLKSAMQGFLQGWYADCTKPMVVDKSRAWLQCIEFLLHLEPQARLLVCVREMGQVYGSIESQHQKTILLDFIDHLADYDRLRRADQLFASDNSIGAALAAIQAVQDLPPAVRERIFFVRFEDLVIKPTETMALVYQWLGLAKHRIDPHALQVRAHESDSHFRHKYLHRQNGRIVAPPLHKVPKRVQDLILKAFGWYCEWFYPTAAPRESQRKEKVNEKVLAPGME